MQDLVIQLASTSDFLENGILSQAVLDAQLLVFGGKMSLIVMFNEELLICYAGFLFQILSRVIGLAEQLPEHFLFGHDSDSI